MGESFPEGAAAALAAAAERAPAAVAMIGRADDGSLRVRWANARAQELAGGRELEGAAVRELLPSAQGRLVSRWLGEALREDAPRTYEATVPRGLAHAGRFSAIAVPVDGLLVVTLTLSSIRDTGVDALEAAAADAHWYVYTYELAADGSPTTLHDSPGWERLLGAEIGAVPDGDTVWVDCVHPDDRALWESLDEPLRRGEPVAAEYRLIGLDGQTRWVWVREVPRVHPDGRIIVSGVATEITPQRDVLERLRDALEEAQEARATTEQALDTLRAIARAAGAYLYAGDIGPEDLYVGTFIGPGSGALLGMESDPTDADTAFEAAVHDDDRPRYERDWTYTRLLEGEPMVLEYRVVGVDGVVRWVRDQIVPHPQPDGRVRVEGAVTDVTPLVEAREEALEAHREAEAAQREAERRSLTDVLTGIWNRRQFAEAVAKELERARRQGQTPAVLMLDVDRFKSINDTYGHTVGDIVLVEIARRLRRAVRQYDTVARWGGEEFAIMVPGLPDAAALHAVGEQVRAAVAAGPVSAGELLLPVTASVGGALASASLWSLEALIDAADRALYAAKRRGRDQTVLASDLTVEDLAAEVPEAIRMAEALARTAALREAMPAHHPDQVAELSAATAERLGLPAGAIMRCRLGGWLHDVGKGGLPDQVLRKQGPLTDVEWELMRSHPEVGEKLVRTIAGLSEAAIAVRHHHERFDGSGYPDGLEGDAIPIEARVVAAADAYSAMTARRAYADAWTHDEALEELRLVAGTHLDPTVVRALIAVLAEQPDWASQRALS